MSIYSKLYQKLIKVPETVTYAFIIVSSFLASLGALLQFDETALIMEGALADIQFNIDVFKWISWIFSGFITWGIVELIIGILFNFAYKYRAVDAHKKTEFKSVVRIFCAVKQFVMGIFEFVYLASAEAYVYGSSILGIVSSVVIFTFAYLVLKNNLINKRRIFTIYSKLFKLYFIVVGILNVIQFIGLVAISPLPVSDVIVSAVCIALLALSAVGSYYLVYKKLKAEEEENKKEPEIIFVNNNDNNPPEIFSGYGF